MKTLQTQYNLIKEGKGHKDVFLKEAKRLFPNAFLNGATFTEAAATLKDRGVITEHYVDLQPVNNMESTPKLSWESKFASFLAEEEVKAEAKKVSKEVEEDLSHAYDTEDKKNQDNLIFDQFQKGVAFEVRQNPDKDLEAIKEIVRKNLAKDPIYYTNNAAFGLKDVGYTDEAVALKPSKSDQMEKVKMNEGRISLLTLLSETEDAKEKEAHYKGAEKDDAAHIADLEQDMEDDKKADKKVKKSVKKESLDFKLAEIEKAGKTVTMEAQIEAIENAINEKNQKINMVAEDESLSELVDKKKMKELQREVKLLEKKKSTVEKMYEKLSGKAYQKKEIVDEMDAASWDDKNGASMKVAPDESLNA